MRGTCDILLRSYYKDFRWLAFCLQSIERYCREFRRVILVVPEDSRKRIGRLKLTCDEIVTCPSYRDDYLGQQVTKLYADTYTDADYICHIDSDCVFRRPVTPHDLREGDRLRIFMIPYRRLDAGIPWRELTERFLGRRVDFEFMRRQPQTFPRWLYPALRGHAEALHGKTIDHYVMSQPHRGFSEFNALCAFAYLNHRDDFAWIDLGGDDVPEPVCDCYWSWGGLQAGIVAEINATLSRSRALSDEIR